MLWIHFTVGRGPNECHAACEGISDIFVKQAIAADLTAVVIDEEQTNYGYLSRLISLEGVNAELFASSWEGTVQWVCPSPFRKGWGRKNWYLGCNIIRPPSEAQALKESDLTIQTFRASGAGGQHVQKTDSAVRIVHKPTGLTTQAQEERSQHRNKALAMARLAALLQQKANAEKKQVDQTIWSNHNSLERGNPVKVFYGANFKS